jgi:hypothetical protein
VAAAPEGKDCIGIASHASNADCEDGGPGSEFQQADCPYGSDCGPRMPTHAARRHPRSPALATAFSFVGTDVNSKLTTIPEGCPNAIVLTPIPESCPNAGVRTPKSHPRGLTECRGAAASLAATALAAAATATAIASSRSAEHRRSGRCRRLGSGRWIL